MFITTGLYESADTLFGVENAASCLDVGTVGCLTGSGCIYVRQLAFGTNASRVDSIPRRS